MIDENGLRAALRANVSRLRAQSGLTQEAAAERLGIARTTLAKLELGLHTPKSDLLFSLADLFGVPADALRQVS